MERRTKGAFIALYRREKVRGRFLLGPLRYVLLRDCDLFLKNEEVLKRTSSFYFALGLGDAAVTCVVFRGCAAAVRRGIVLAVSGLLDRKSIV